MKREADRPADTAMMGIVHDALRRDLDRLRTALSTEPYPTGARRTALADHVEWLMDFLHEHHTGEDTALYPLVRARADDRERALLDDMTADHERVDAAMSALRAAAAAWRAGRGRTTVLAALEELCAVLRPHLDREEAEAMPIVSRTMSHREWRRLDHETHVAPKSFTQLGTIGHWLIDGLDRRRRDIVLHEVPLVPRYVLLWGFGPGYRRQAAARWQPAG
jgi:hemerythrin-like domain-containing protein